MNDRVLQLNGRLGFKVDTKTTRCRKNTRTWKRRSNVTANPVVYWVCFTHCSSISAMYRQTRSVKPSYIVYAWNPSIVKLLEAPRCLTSISLCWKQSHFLTGRCRTLLDSVPKATCVSLRWFDKWCFTFVIDFDERLEAHAIISRYSVLVTRH